MIQAQIFGGPQDGKLVEIVTAGSTYVIPIVAVPRLSDEPSSPEFQTRTYVYKGRRTADGLLILEELT